MEDLSRWTMRQLCHCDCSGHAPRPMSRRDHDRSQETTAKWLALEQNHVYDVYDKIAHHLKDAKHKAWPNVKQFLLDLEPGSLVADVGCGNGRYLHINKSIYKVGSDRCGKLVDLVGDQHEVMVCDNLRLPYRDDVFDAVVSIAVIHHFTTVKRRVQAIRELARILRPGGRVMIYVWAMEQRHRKFDAQDVLVPWHFQPKQRKKRDKSRPQVEKELSSTSSFSEDDTVTEPVTSAFIQSHVSKTANHCSANGSHEYANLHGASCHVYDYFEDLRPMLSGQSQSHTEISGQTGAFSDFNGAIISDFHNDSHSKYRDFPEENARSLPSVAQYTGSSLARENHMGSPHKQLQGKGRVQPQMSNATASEETLSSSSKLSILNFYPFAKKHDVHKQHSTEEKKSYNIPEFIKSRLSYILGSSKAQPKVMRPEKLGHRKKDNLYRELIQNIMKHDDVFNIHRPVLEHSLSAPDVEMFDVREFPQSSQPRCQKQISLDLQEARDIYLSQGNVSEKQIESSKNFDFLTFQQDPIYGNVVGSMNGCDPCRVSDKLPVNGQDASPHVSNDIIGLDKRADSEGSIETDVHTISDLPSTISTVSHKRPQCDQVSNSGCDTFQESPNDNPVKFSIGEHEIKGTDTEDDHGLTWTSIKSIKHEYGNQGIIPASDAETDSGVNINEKSLSVESPENCQCPEKKSPLKSPRGSENTPRRKLSSDTDAEDWVKDTRKAIQSMQTKIINQASSESGIETSATFSSLDSPDIGLCTCAGFVNSRRYHTALIHDSLSLSSDAYSDTDSEEQEASSTPCTSCLNKKLDNPRSRPQSPSSKKLSSAVKSKRNPKHTELNEDRSSPEKEEDKSTYQRYYHVFKEGELTDLINDNVECLHILESYYDHANWCVIAEKVKVWTI